MKLFTKSQSFLEWNFKSWARREEWASVRGSFRQLLGSENLGNKTLVTNQHYILFFISLFKVCVCVCGGVSEKILWELVISFHSFCVCSGNSEWEELVGRPSVGAA